MYKRMLKILRSEKGEAFVGEGVKIVMCVVLGAALLAGFVLTFNKVILPKTGLSIKALFNSTDANMAYLEWDSEGRKAGDSIFKELYYRQTDWYTKGEAGAYSDIMDDSTRKEFDKMLTRETITIGKVTLPTEFVAEAVRENIKDGSVYDERETAVYTDWLNAYDAINEPEAKRKCGTAEKELDKKLNRVENDVYAEYVSRYGGEDAFEEYCDNLSDEDAEALSREYESKCMQKYSDTIKSVGTKYGFEITDEMVNEYLDF